MARTSSNSRTRSCSMRKPCARLLVAVDAGGQRARNLAVRTSRALLIDNVEHYEFRILSRLTRDASPFEPASSGMKKGRNGSGGGDVFVHISAVERAGLHYEIESNRGKSPRLTSRSNDCCVPLGHNSANGSDA